MTNKTPSCIQRLLSICLCSVFLLIQAIPNPYIFAQASNLGVSLPVPGQMVMPSAAFEPALLQGLKLHAENPLIFDFLVSQGEGAGSDGELRAEAQRMFQYFFAALTVPEDQMWVNLSPYEGDRIIPDHLALTDMGEDLLAQDYILKQLTASLMYPEDAVGQDFWQRIYDRAYREFGTTDIPVNTLSKVWIVPDKAVVYEHDAGALVLECHLKVMLEDDYVAWQQSQGKAKEGMGQLLNAHAKGGEAQDMMNDIVRDVLLPEIEREVNTGAHFKPLRQIFHAVILAKWYKQTLRRSVLGHVYIDKNKMAGIDVNDLTLRQQIYDRYLEAFKKGVYNEIREEVDAVSGDIVPRRYFLGGTTLKDLQVQTVSGPAMSTEVRQRTTEMGQLALFEVGANPVRSSLNNGNGNGNGYAAPRWERPRVNPEPKPYQFTQPDLDTILREARGSDVAVVHDLSLEAFLSGLSGEYQKALGKGGLGFLTGETWESYAALRDAMGMRAFGAMPLYAHYQAPGGQPKKLDWDQSGGFQPVMVQGPDGREQALVVPVNFQGAGTQRDKDKVYQVKVYWMNANGTVVFGFHNEEMFNRLYPGGDEQWRQYGFMARAYVEVMKALSLQPDSVRISEGQLGFVWQAMKNDIAFYESVSQNGPRQEQLTFSWATGENGESQPSYTWENVTPDKKSIFVNAEKLLTTHTPEVAALPVAWNIGHLQYMVGPDLVDANDITHDNGHTRYEAALVAARGATLINGVSVEHGDQVTRQAIFPDASLSAKTVSIQNGSNPDLWTSPQLKDLVARRGGIDHVSGEELFNVTQQRKRDLNAYLRSHYDQGFSDLDRPLVGLVRRIVQYKEQGLLFSLLEWMVGDPGTTYDVQVNGSVLRLPGLGANLLVGGHGLDDQGKQWVAEFKRRHPSLAGRFIYVEDSGIELMQLATSGSDIWTVLARQTREASGTSDERAGFNGNYNINTATGGPLEYIVPGLNGDLLDAFEIYSVRYDPQTQRRTLSVDHARLAHAINVMQNPEARSEDVRQWQIHTQEQMIAKLQSAVQRYRDFKQHVDTGAPLPLAEGEFSWGDGMKAAYTLAREYVDVQAMVFKYGAAYQSLLESEDGTDVSSRFQREVASLGSYDWRQRTFTSFQDASRAPAALNGNGNGNDNGNVGGIDLDADSFELQLTGTGLDMNVALESLPEALVNASGFSPEIRRYTATPDVDSFLGLTNTLNPASLSLRR